MKSELFKGAWWKYVLASDIFIHLILLCFDAANHYVPFLRGDRSYNRWTGMAYYLAKSSEGWISAMAHSGVVPGEYILHVPFYLIAGKLGMIIFQVALSIASVMAIGAVSTRIFSWRYAPLVICAIYLSVPQCIAFAHQFVTEGVSASLTILFVYFSVLMLEKSDLRFGLLAGACLGIAIFVRPSLLLIVPTLVVLGLWAGYVFRERLFIGLTVICAIAILPLSLWVIMFTLSTGKIGYTSGVANLDWNLRSRVYLVQTANATTKIPEVANYGSYAALYADSGGIKLSRFISVAVKHPFDYMKGAIVDELITFGKGNTTKLTVDYLGIAGDKGLKDWRNHFEKGGIVGLITWGAGNSDVVFVSTVEFVSSLLTLPATIIAISVAVWAVVRPRSFISWFGKTGLFVAYLIFSIFLSVAASALLVDRAQAKLRHPVEAGFILLLGMAFILAREAWSRRTDGIVFVLNNRETSSN
jgi:hypothetical protein